MKVVINNTEFTVPDSKMKLVKTLLWEVCSGAQNLPGGELTANDWG